MIGNLESKIPSGPLSGKWSNHKDHAKLVAPNNRRKFEIIVVGSGLAGGSAAATLGELGYRVKCFCYQDSPRRAHSIAAQGGINAAKIIRTMATASFDFLRHDQRRRLSFARSERLSSGRSQ